VCVCVCVCVCVRARACVLFIAAPPTCVAGAVLCAYPPGHALLGACCCCLGRCRPCGGLPGSASLRAWWGAGRRGCGEAAVMGPVFLPVAQLQWVPLPSAVPHLERVLLR
jgi:hypothetical protein